MKVISGALRISADGFDRDVQQVSVALHDEFDAQKCDLVKLFKG